jgi:enoyl-CoA hydratase/carnithine racemase
MTKEAINLSMDSPSLETIIQIENRTQMLCLASKDAITGMQAKIEKKQVNYPLR